MPMHYYARSANDDGDRETVQHHLQCTAELCAAYTSEFGCPEAGSWMGLLHDFGKYSEAFQQVLDGKKIHVDHAFPGAAFVAAQLCAQREKSPLWPLAAAVRAHHSAMQYDFSAELSAWQEGEAMSPRGDAYSLSGKELLVAVKTFYAENSLPKQKPSLPRFPARTGRAAIQQKMTFSRMLFSALTDADYSASAEHFDKDYLQKTAVPALDPQAAWEQLEGCRARLAQASRADSAVNELRGRLFACCAEAGAQAPPGVYTLTAPTGAGKTLAMLAFGLQQMLRHQKRRMIFVLPYLSIIEQNAAVYRDILPDILEDHSQAERGEDTAAGRELSQRWDAPVIITTSVKFFESLFACTGPACRKLHRLADSVILFDEAQSLPARLAETTLTELQELAQTYRSTVVFSTATQPDFCQLPGVLWEPQEIVPDPQQMFSQARRVNVRWLLQQPMPLERIAEEAAQGNNACVLVNLRGHAQKVYQALCAQCGRDATFLFTTDLCPAHRTQILRRVRERLAQGLPCYLAATQCIEAGVDISFDVMFRALAPLESIIQAAGRCNRSDTRRRGQVTVFLPDEATLYPDDFYRQSANAVLTLAARHEIDLNELGHIREYYGILFGGGQVREALSLTQAVEAVDFPAVAKAYRLIEDVQLQVLVPCPGEEALFGQLAEEGRRGVTAGWMRRAAPLTVHSYRKKQVEDVCEPLYIFVGKERMRTASGWYILTNPALYDASCGLQLSAAFDGIL